MACRRNRRSTCFGIGMKLLIDMNLSPFPPKYRSAIYCRTRISILFHPVIVKHWKGIRLFRLRSLRIIECEKQQLSFETLTPCNTS